MGEKKGRKPGTKNAPKQPVLPPAKPARTTRKAAKPDPNRPVPPANLDADALLVWESLCDDLAEQKTLDRTDRKLMEAYCRLYLVFLRIEEQLAGEKLTLQAGVGRSFLNPLVTCLADYGNKLRQDITDVGGATGNLSLVYCYVALPFRQVGKVEA